LPPLAARLAVPLMPSPDLEREALQEALDRLAVFSSTNGDYLAPLIAAYDESGEETYKNAVKRLRADIQLVVHALARKLME
jgi:hypothetical protein